MIITWESGRNLAGTLRHASTIRHTKFFLAEEDKPTAKPNKTHSLTP
jgi:hypothetical protein